MALHYNNSYAKADCEENSQRSIQSDALELTLTFSSFNSSSLTSVSRSAISSLSLAFSARRSLISWSCTAPFDAATGAGAATATGVGATTAAGVGGVGVLVTTS
jgi:hypothetical protein